MKKFKIIETKPSVECWSYAVEAESQEQAIEMITEGLVDHEDYWINEDPFERFEYEVESEEEVDDNNDEDYQSGLLYGVDNNQ